MTEEGRRREEVRREEDGGRMEGVGICFFCEQACVGEQWQR